MRKSFNLLFVIFLLIFNIMIVKSEEKKCYSVYGGAEINCNVEDVFYANSSTFFPNFSTNPNQLKYIEFEDEEAAYIKMFVFERNDNKYVGFCRDGGWWSLKPGMDIKGFNNSNSKQSLKSTRLFDTSNNNKTKEQLAYERGIIEILTSNDFKAPTGSTYVGDETIKKFVASNLAQRVYDIYWNRSYSGNHKYHLVSKAYAYMGILDGDELLDPKYDKEYVGVRDYLDILKVQEEINTINDKISSNIKQNYYSDVQFKINGNRAYGIWDGTNWSGEETIIDYSALTLLKKALKASIDYLKNGAASVTFDKPVKDGARKENEKTTVSYTHTFKINKFTGDNAYINLQFNCANCQNKSINYQASIIKADGQQIPIDLTNNRTIDLLDYIENKNSDSVHVKIEFSTTKEDENCKDVEYKLNLSYFEPSISTEAYTLDACLTYEQCQRYNVLVNKKAEFKKEISQNIDFCIKYDKCTTYIENKNCEDIDGENIIKIEEGHKVTSSDTNYCESSNLDVETCIIESYDDVSNSYVVNYSGQETGFNNVNAEENKYCKVYCKEDYHLTLPEIKETTSGRYFSLEANVKGTKTCYTSKIDEKNEFKVDIEKARKELINAYNDWAFKKARYEADLIENVDNIYCPGTCLVGNLGCVGGSTKLCSIKTRTFSYTTYDYSGKETLNPKYDFYGDRASGTCCGYSCKCYQYPERDEATSLQISKEEYYLNEIHAKEEYEEATKILESLIDKYINFINDYNECYGLNTFKYENTLKEITNYNEIGWEMHYKYDDKDSPTISFWYEEEYMNAYSGTELKANLVNSSFNKTGITEKHYNSKISSNNEILNSLFGNLTNDGSISNSNNMETFTCYALSTGGYSCGNKTIKVGKADYVEQSIDVEASYKTPTHFYSVYPSGAIIANPPDKVLNNKNISALEEKLPVGLGTKQGVYNYTLMVDNLGEYYNGNKAGTLGRIWGDSESVVVDVLNDAENNRSCTKKGALTTKYNYNGNGGLRTDISEGAYVCTYTINTDSNPTYPPGTNDDPCPNNKCPIVCDPVCRIPNCKNNDCPTECENCLYTNNSSNISYKPISPGIVNPSGKEPGVNWKWEEPPKTAMEIKAYVTSKEIETDQEFIYESTSSLDRQLENDYSVEITLNADTISWIKKYADEKYDKSAGYATNTLNCYDYKKDGVTYDNIFCYSKFIDEMIYDEKGDIKINGKDAKDSVRIISGDAEQTHIDRKAVTNPNYWTVWDTWDSSEWNLVTNIGFTYQSDYKNNIGIGPSWK